jgi:hypothetical protein
MTQPMPVKPPKVRRPITETAPGLLLFVLAVTALVVSGWSMATLLHDQASAPWWVASLGVGVFDVLALQAALLVKARRDDPWKAAGAQCVMILSVISSMVVNGAHGWSLGGWTTAMVLGAAPVTFEVAFAIKYRTLTVLIWVLFGKESMTRLRHEAWSRIALPDVPDSPAIIPGSVERMAPVERISGRSGIRNQVAELYGSGITDPERIIAELPESNPESIRRYVREIRKSG